MRRKVDRSSENNCDQPGHNKKSYVQPKLVKADKLAQVTQGFEPISESVIDVNGRLFERTQLCVK